MEENCANLYNIAGGAFLSVLFIISEIMPFIKSVKSNGLIEAAVSVVSKKKPRTEQETIRDDAAIRNYEHL